MDERLTLVFLIFLLISFGCSENTDSDPITIPTSVLPSTPESTTKSISERANDSKTEPTPAPTLTVTEELISTSTATPTPTASSTPTLEPTSTEEPATETVQPPTLEPTDNQAPPATATFPSTAVPPTVQITITSPPLPTATHEQAPPSNFPRTPSKKTGEVWYVNRTITFCSGPDGFLGEDTDENGYPNGVFSLITHIQSVNYGNGTILVIDNLGNKTYFPIDTIKIMDHPVESTPANQFSGTINDLEPGDCVLLRKMDDSQGIPTPSDSILVWGFK